MVVQPDDPPERPHAGVGKLIAPARDQQQSRWLTAVVGSLLCLAAAHQLLRQHRFHGSLILPLTISVLFAAAARSLRAATGSAAACGALVCLLLSLPQTTAAGAVPTGPVSRALFALVALFLLTLGATRFRRGTKEAFGAGEARQGRRASQIVANLGMAGLCAAAGFPAGALAALTEATADTVSSEIGQALGGPTWMLTTLARVPPGSDGGISLRGTMAGLLAAAAIVAAGAGMLPSPESAVIVYLSAAAGLFFDSLLGATAERRGILGNDLVNFSSTLASAVLASAIVAVRSNP